MSSAKSLRTDHVLHFPSKISVTLIVGTFMHPNEISNLLKICFLRKKEQQQKIGEFKPRITHVIIQN